MTSKTLILSEFIADFILQLRIQELQNISHKQPLKLSKLDSIFLDIPFNLSNRGICGKWFYCNTL